MVQDGKLGMPDPEFLRHLWISWISTLTFGVCLTPCMFHLSWKIGCFKEPRYRKEWKRGCSRLPSTNICSKSRLFVSQKSHASKAWFFSYTRSTSEREVLIQFGQKFSQNVAKVARSHHYLHLQFRKEVHPQLPHRDQFFFQTLGRSRWDPRKRPCREICSQGGLQGKR